MNARQLVMVSVVAMLAGCVKPPLEGRMDPYPPAQIHFAQPVLKNQTAVGKPVATRDEAGSILYVTVPIRSATNEELYVDYRVTFFDSNGQKLNQTAWFQKVLTPNVPDSITVNSLGPRAADFQVDFRNAK